jgi:hypothetical protein
MDPNFIGQDTQAGLTIGRHMTDAPLLLDKPESYFRRKKCDRGPVLHAKCAPRALNPLPVSTDKALDLARGRAPGYDHLYLPMRMYPYGQAPCAATYAHMKGIGQFQGLKQGQLFRNRVILYLGVCRPGVTACPSLPRADILGHRQAAGNRRIPANTLGFRGITQAWPADHHPLIHNGNVS